jgi:hypothetical protein
MIKFDKPENLNGSQLLTELNAGNVKITNPPLIDDNKDFWLDIDLKDEAKAKSIVSAHIGIDNSAQIAAQRQVILDRLGLTADEARLLLG